MVGYGERGVGNAVIAVVGGVAVLAGLVGVVAAFAMLSGSGEGAPSETKAYVSLGDSVAAGSGASDAERTSFAALVAADQDGISLFNAAVAGATTQDMLDEQIARALPALQADRAAFVTISAGGNDLAGLIPNASCVEDPLPDTCPLDAALEGVRANLRTILSYLRDANGRTPIVVLAYPNFFSGTGHAFEAPAARVLPRLNEVIEDVAAEYDHVAVARPAEAFEGHGDTLTGVLAAQFDPHPNDAGHRAIADAMLAALREARG